MSSLEDPFHYLRGDNASKVSYAYFFHRKTYRDPPAVKCTVMSSDCSHEIAIGESLLISCNIEHELVDLKGKFGAVCVFHLGPDMLNTAVEASVEKSLRSVPGWESDLSCEDRKKCIDMLIKGESNEDRLNRLKFEGDPERHPRPQVFVELKTAADRMYDFLSRNDCENLPPLKVWGSPEETYEQRARQVANPAHTPRDPPSSKHWAYATRGNAPVANGSAAAESVPDA